MIPKRVTKLLNETHKPKTPWFFWEWTELESVLAARLVYDVSEAKKGKDEKK